MRGFLYSFIPCLVYFILVKYRDFLKDKSGFRNFGLLVLFLFYLFFVLMVTGIDSVYFWKGVSFERINFILFDSFFEIGSRLNILLFVPFGFLVPLIWKEYRGVWRTVLLGGSCSFMIEILQLFCNRITDIDDLMMNTLGCFLGYFIWRLGYCYWKRKKGLQENGEEDISVVGKSPRRWIVLLFVGYLFLSV